LQFIDVQWFLQKLFTPVRFLGRAKVQILLYKQHPVEIFFGEFGPFRPARHQNWGGEPPRRAYLQGLQADCILILKPLQAFPPARPFLTLPSLRTLGARM
jgi:hypothetical protein